MKFSIQPLLLASLLCFLTNTARALSIKCVEKVPPVGGEDTFGRASYLDFRQDSEGKYQLSYATGCNYVWPESKCRKEQAVWNFDRCEIREQKDGYTWICSQVDAENCFFAHFDPNQPAEYFLNGMFEFSNFRACLKSTPDGHDSNKFVSTGVIAGCSISP